MKEKVVYLIHDERRYISRTIIAAFPCFLIAFTYCIFGPVDLTAANRADFSFGWQDVALHYVLIGAFVSAAAAVLTALLRGRIFDCAVCGLAGFGLASYLQGTLLNIELGILNGQTIIWSNYTEHAVLNAALWLVILLLPFALRYFFDKHWIKITCFVSAAVVLMQLAGLTGTLLTLPPLEEEYRLSSQEQFEVSATVF